MEISDRRLGFMRETGLVFRDEARAMAGELLRLRGKLKEGQEVLRDVRDEVRRERRERKSLGG